jgi:uncharacterized membrane protein
LWNAKRPVLRSVRNYFITGLILFIPVFITIWALSWAFNTIDGVLKEPFESAFGWYRQGIGFGLTIILIFIFGIVGSRVAGRNAIRFVEFHIKKIPVIRELYNGTKQIIESFNRQESGNFVEVVFIEFPRKGTFTPGLVTNVAYDETGRKMLNVYVPTAPNPTSGFLQILPEDQIVRTDMTVDECMKMVISAGKYSHPDVRCLALEQPPDTDSHLTGN